MNFLIMTLSIVIIIGLLVGAFYFISKRKSLTVKITHWMLFIYIGVLVISMITIPFMTKNSFISQKHLTDQEIEQNRHAFYEKVRSGQLSEIDDKHLLKHSSFEYDQPLLTLQYTGVEYPQVFIERKETNDQFIEAYSYISGLYIDGVDFSHELDPHKFDLFKDKLTISPPERDIIDISMIKREFPITQFLGGGMFFQIFQHEGAIIYLEVPQNIEIINSSDLSIEYVKK